MRRSADFFSLSFFFGSTFPFVLHSERAHPAFMTDSTNPKNLGKLLLSHCDEKVQEKSRAVKARTIHYSVSPIEENRVRQLGENTLLDP